MRLFSTLILGAICANVAFGGQITAEQALSNARTFLATSGSKAMKAKGTQQLKLVKATPGYFAFSAGEGFVLASASDLTQPVLGYCDSGTLDYNKMAPATKWWIEQLEQAVVNLEAGKTQEKKVTRNLVATNAEKEAIAPLLTCKWNQGDPFNIKTPSYVQNGNTYAHSATGCVATATTQVMYYWKCPQEATKTVPSYTYNWQGNYRTMPALEPIVFDWANMKDELNGSSPQATKDAVATLMLYAGCGMQSGYGPATGATSVNALNALKNYFGYASDAFNVYHLDYTFQEWEDLYYNELAAGRPILMGADNYERTGGHEFVCDGYKPDHGGLYHINWGWGGWCDGYFVLTVMAPDSQGIGGSSDANGYSMGQNACIALRPANMAVEEGPIRAAISNLYSPQSTYQASNGTFKVNITAKLRSLLFADHTMQHCYELTDKDDKVVAGELDVAEGVIYPSRSITWNSNVSLSGLSDGVYTLKGRSRAKGATEWLDDMNGDHNYLKLTVEGSKLTVENIPGRGENLHVNSVKLVGESKAGEWQQVVYNITNNGADFYGETYMFVDGKRSSGNTISIPAGTTADIYYKFQPTNTPGDHNFVLSRNTSLSGAISNQDVMYNINCWWDANGNVKAMGKSGQFTVPAEATAIYVYGSSPATVTMGSANPNLIAYFDADAKISSRVLNVYRKSIKTIVLGDHADEAEFVDGYNLRIPKAFTADKVSYIRNNAEHWSSVAVPFDVNKITIKETGEELHWFRSVADTEGNVMVKSFSGNRGSNMVFKHLDADKMTANTVYLLGVCGTVEGKHFDNIGKTLVFQGENTKVNATSEIDTTSKPTKLTLVPCYSDAKISGVWALNEDATAFERLTASTPGVPFRGYVTYNTTTAKYNINYADGERAGINDVITDGDQAIDANAPVYNLLGVKVGVYAEFDNLDRGIYIVSGKKLVK